MCQFRQIADNSRNMWMNHESMEFVDEFLSHAEMTSYWVVSGYDLERSFNSPHCLFSFFVFIFLRRWKIKLRLGFLTCVRSWFSWLWHDCKPGARDGWGKKKGVLSQFVVFAKKPGSFDERVIYDTRTEPCFFFVLSSDETLIEGVFLTFEMNYTLKTLVNGIYQWSLFLWRERKERV